MDTSWLRYYFEQLCAQVPSIDPRKALLGTRDRKRDYFVEHCCAAGRLVFGKLDEVMRNCSSNLCSRILYISQRIFIVSLACTVMVVIL